MAFPQQLIDGYRAFLIGRLRHEQDRYLGLAESRQSPQIMVIGCCDSRVSPEVIFDARPGELFVVRTWRISCHLSRRTDEPTAYRQPSNSASARLRSGTLSCSGTRNAAG